MILCPNQQEKFDEETIIEKKGNIKVTEIRLEIISFYPLNTFINVTAVFEASFSISLWGENKTNFTTNRRHRT